MHFWISSIRHIPPMIPEDERMAYVLSTLQRVTISDIESFTSLIFFHFFCKYAAHALILCLSSIFISFWFCLNFTHYNAYFFDSFSSLPSHLRFVYCLTIVNCRRQFSDSCQILHHSAYIAVVFLLLLTSYFYYYRCCYYRNKRCRRHCYPATTAFFLVRSMCDKFECLARVDVCIYFDDGILVTLDPSHSVSAFFLLDEEKRHFKIDNVFI